MLEAQHRVPKSLRIRSMTSIPVIGIVPVRAVICGVLDIPLVALLTRWLWPNLFIIGFIAIMVLVLGMAPTLSIRGRLIPDWIRIWLRGQFRPHLLVWDRDTIPDEALMVQTNPATLPWIPSNRDAWMSGSPGIGPTTTMEQEN